MEAWDTVRMPVPGFWTVMVCVFVTPTVTLPKLTLEGVTEIKGFTPAPLREMVAGELVALLTTLTVPETLPAAAGANATLNEAVCPADRVTGKLIADRLNPVPLVVI